MIHIWSYLIALLSRGLSYKLIILEFKSLKTYHRISPCYLLSLISRIFLILKMGSNPFLRALLSTSITFPQLFSWCILINLSSFCSNAAPALKACLFLANLWVFSLCFYNYKQTYLTAALLYSNCRISLRSYSLLNCVSFSLCYLKTVVTACLYPQKIAHLLEMRN